MLKYLLFFTLSFSYSMSTDGDERFIDWESGRLLTWEDFQGAPNTQTNMLAETNSRIGYAWECEGGKFKATVTCRFDRQKSWKKDVLTDKLLAHEQLHFDITELHARQLRKVFASLEDDACNMEEEEIKDIANQVRAQWKATQDMYDLDTQHSKDRVAQSICSTVSTAQGRTRRRRPSASLASSLASTINRRTAMPDRPHPPWQWIKTLCPALN